MPYDDKHTIVFRLVSSFNKFSLCCCDFSIESTMITVSIGNVSLNTPKTQQLLK